MHTPLEFYVTLPQDLYRLGRATKAKLNYLRTTPPRDIDTERWDIMIYESNDIKYVDSKSGGISLFNYRNPNQGHLWWKIAKGTKLPTGLHISLDEGGKKGQQHFTVRPLSDMPLTVYISKLLELEKAAKPCFLSKPNTQAN